MAVNKKISLSVNNTPVNLDEFVGGYLEHVTGGIIDSLKNTGEIDTLKLTIDNENQVAIMLNNAEVPLSYFPVEIIRSTVLGMVAPLKGVSSSVDSLELTIS